MTNQLTIKCPDLGEISATKCAVRRNSNADCTGCSAWNRFAQETQQRVERDPFAECQFLDVLNYSRPKSPAMTMYPKGDIGLNKDAVEAFGEVKLCKLFYDAKTGVLGIKPLEKHEAGSLSIASNTRSGNARISGALLCKTFGITARPKAAPLTWSPIHGMWCARLPKEGR